MASTPASAASRASSTVWMPLMTSGPCQTERIHSTSRHDRAGSNCVLTYSDSVTAVLPSPIPTDSPTLAKRIGSDRRNRQVQPGWTAPSTSVRNPTLGGSEKPRRTSRSRRPSTAVSTVSDQRLVAGAGGPPDHLLHEAPVAPDVHLEPLRSGAGLRHLLDRAGAERRQGVRQAGPRRRPRYGQLAVGIGDAGEARRRQDQRQRQAAPEQRRRRVDVADVPQHPGPEHHPGERRRVGRHRALVLGRTVDVVEHPPGQAPPGDGAQVGDRRRPRQPTDHRIELQATEPEHRPQRFDHRSSQRSR